MKMIYKYSALYLLLFSHLVACKKFVQIDPPVTLLSTAGVFNNNGTATSAQLAIYSQMYSQLESYNMSRNCGLLSDELGTYSNATNDLQYYDNSMFATSGPGPWTSAYQYIYWANAIIEGLQKSNGVSQPVRKQLTGESKFIRAFWQFYLASCYGDVPLVTSTDYTVNANLTRASKGEVFQQILSDLNDARNLLSNNYIDFSDTTVTNERTRPTRWAANALLARVYLNIGKYDSAEFSSSEVINNVDLYELKSNLNDVFLANSKEAIWQLQTPLPSSFSTTEGNAFILTAAPTGSNVFINPTLLDSFELGDGRRNNWIHDTVFADKQYSYPYKYKLKFYGTSPQEYTMVLRLAEQYLIRAEARARSGNLIGPGSAADDLNMIRHRAGLGDYIGGSNDQNSILNAILHERQVELFTEWGHRWFDLIRMQKINEVMSIVTPMKGGNWNPDGYQQLFPLPQSEININNKLMQNPEYN